MIAALSDSQFNTLVTVLGGLALAVLQWLFSQRNKAATDECKAHVETVKLKVDEAEVKRTETSKTVDTILVDVNSKSQTYIDRIKSQEDTIREMGKSLAVFEERMRPVATAVNGGHPLPSAEQIAEKVVEAIKTNATK